MHSNGIHFMYTFYVLSERCWLCLCYYNVIKDDEQGIEDNVLVSELDKYLMFRLPAPKENSKLKGYYGPSMKNLKILKIYRNIRSFVIFARRQRLPHHQKSFQTYFVYTRFGDYRRESFLKCRIKDEPSQDSLVR